MQIGPFAPQVKDRFYIIKMSLNFEIGTNGFDLRMYYDIFSKPQALIKLLKVLELLTFLNLSRACKLLKLWKWVNSWIKKNILGLAPNNRK